MNSAISLRVRSWGSIFTAKSQPNPPNLLAEMQQMGYVIIATDASKQVWTQIDIPRFRVVAERKAMYCGPLGLASKSSAILRIAGRYSFSWHEGNR